VISTPGPNSARDHSTYSIRDRRIDVGHDPTPSGLEHLAGPTPVASLTCGRCQGSSPASLPLRGAAVLPVELCPGRRFLGRGEDSSSRPFRKRFLPPLARFGRTEAMSASPLPRPLSRRPDLPLPLADSGPRHEPDQNAVFFSVSFCFRSRSTFSARACSGAARPLPVFPLSTPSAA